MAAARVINFVKYNIIFTFCIGISRGQTVTVKTSYGEVSGFTTAIDSSRFVEKYLGIPYASAPIGELRWKSPKRHPGWSSPLNATQYGSTCPQLEVEEPNEDCLFLNLFVPVQTNGENSTLSTMIFISPGGFRALKSERFDGSQLSIFGNVIVVTFNYRIGALGFMSTGDEQSAGNFGLMDQRAAIEWVKENIENFGGNSESVTLFGESAGAGSTFYQLFYGLSANDSNASAIDRPKLFQRIIAESGVANEKNIYESSPAQYAIELGRILNCPTFVNFLLVQCLREISAENIVAAQSDIEITVEKLIWIPTKDGDFIKDDPWSLLGSDQVKQELKGKYEFMLGVNEFDFSQDPQDVLTESAFTDFMLKETENFMEPYKVTEAALLEYVDWKKDYPPEASVWREMASNSSRDVNYIAPHINFSTIASAEDGFNSTVYFYFFTQKPSQVLIDNSWAVPRSEAMDWIAGPLHGEELAYVFGVPLDIENSDQTDKDFSQKIMRYWTNFAKYGNPNNDETEVKWPTFKGQTSNYINLNGNQTVVQSHLEIDRAMFWTETVPLLDAGDYAMDAQKIVVNSTADYLDPVVNTTNGAVRGLRISSSSVIVDRFFRIPFAKPPVGKLRFQPPEQHDGWDGILDCNGKISTVEFLNACMMIGILPGRTWGKEDCLHLNVWVPGGVDPTRKTKLPVMVWFYGGAFFLGSSTGINFFYDMEAIVRQGNVIGVSVNYRLGPLGFLSTMDENAKGNAGLFDQLAGLQWVQDNIAAFGGDPNKVTIYGESAGSGSVALHMISPLSKDLFLRGISESGSIPADWTIQKDPLHWAQDLGKNLDCSIESTKVLVGCLTDKPAEEVVRGVKTFHGDYYGTRNSLSWQPVVDGVFVLDHPVNMLNSSKDKDYIIGHNSMDGHLFATLVYPGINLNIPMSRDDVVAASKTFATNVPETVSNAVAFKYIKWEEPERDNLWPKLAIVDIFTDSMFVAGSYWTANERIASNGKGKTYMYRFSKSEALRIWPDWMEADHTSELFYTFGKPLTQKRLGGGERARFNSSDERLSKAMMTYWTNFAWSGNPNYPNEVDILTTWPEYKSNTKYFIEFNTTNADMPNNIIGSNYRGEYVHFWRDWIDDIWRSPPETCLPGDEKGETIKKAVPKIHDTTIQRDVVCPAGEYVRKTNYGCVEGFVEDELEQYLGIPYAVPPIGNLRFTKPQPPVPWEDTIDGKNFSKICPQSESFNESIMSEDCLFLNIYKPISNDTNSELLAVMVWIHGGSYQYGDGMGSSPVEVLSKYGGTIVVTINYRLGAFGFMSTEDANAPGNYGLFDQNLAMKWVTENIQYFGGDTERITVFGESAGAQSAILQILSPLTENLKIQNFMLESIPIIPKDMNQFPATLQLANYINCEDVSDTTKVVECLRQADVDSILHSGIQFLPTVDGEFLPKHPDEMIDIANTKKYNYLMGTNSGEGSVRWGDTQKVKNLDDFHDLVEKYFRDVYGWRTNSIEQEYINYDDLNFGNDMQAMHIALTNMFGDERYFSTTLKYAEKFASNSTVYLYYFTYAYESDNFYGFPIWAGAAHYAEVPFVFGEIISDDLKSKEEKILSETMIYYWSNFAKKSNPNQNQDLIEWPSFKSRFSSSVRNYLRLDIGDNIIAGENLKPTENAFWNMYMVQQEKFCKTNKTNTDDSNITPAAVADDTVILTTNGPILGQVAKTSLYELVQFFGIPYAKPPVGNLRFANPVLIESWNTVFKATTPSPPCLQHVNGDIIGNEDCLYLDVFMPTGIKINTPSLEVLVWIHGDANENKQQTPGSFWSGGGSPGSYENAMDPSFLSFNSNIMIIRPNFRIGAFGFLTTETNILPGNYGIHDLHMVLKWAKENVLAFGGNPDKITLWGQGSGAFASELLASHPETSVNQVISSSGALTSPWAVCANNKHCKDIARNLGNSVGCEITNDENEFLKCLRQLPANKIVNAIIPDKISSEKDSYNLWGTWRVNPNDDVFKKASEKNYSILSGTANHEFYHYLNDKYTIDSTALFNANLLTQAIRDTSEFLPGQDIENWSSNTYSMLDYAYTDWSSLDDENAEKISTIKYYSDYFFAVDSSKSIFVSSTESSNKIYQYLLTEQPSWQASNNVTWLGSCHGDDVIYAFGFPFLHPTLYTDADREFSQTIMTYWTMFARTGNPNNVYSNHWPGYTSNKTTYLELNSRRNIDLEISHKTNYNIDKNYLWEEISSKESQQLPQTTEKSLMTNSVTQTNNPVQTGCDSPTAVPIADGIGLSLTPEEASTAIYVLFSLSLVFAVCLFSLFVYIIFTKQKFNSKASVLQSKLSYANNFTSKL